MIKNIELEKAAYDFKAKMPLRQAIPLGLQHVFAMFVGNLTPLLIITSACGLAGGEFADLQISLLQNAMFVATEGKNLRRGLRKKPSTVSNRPPRMDAPMMAP